MNKSKVYFFSGIILTVGVIALLVSGDSLLLISLNSAGTLPLGTIITWAGMISLPLTIYWGVGEFRTPTTGLTRVLSGLLKGGMLAGLLWVPIAYLLAGNLSFSFSQKETFQGGQDAMRWFWVLSYGIAIIAISTICTYWIYLFFKRSPIGK